jgi:alpha-beta hydrolase superfamily lysophospholipase
MKKILKFILKIGLVIFLLLNIIVAFHAYKFTHFYNNGEIAIKKQEDKTTWDKTKEILFGINAVKQQNAIADSINEKVILTTRDKIKLEGWYTAVDSAKGTVCMFHGHGGKKSGNNAEAEAFRKMGYNTFQIDFRAHGSSSGNTCTIGYDESEDVKLAYDFISTKGEKNIILWGISMGAATITKAINDFALQPQKVILEMPFGTIEDAVKGRLKLMGLPAQPIATLLTFWGGAEHGFWAFNMQPQEYAKKITCPVLLQWGANDPRVSKNEEDILFTNLATKNKKFVVYNTAAHESLCKKENEKWVGEIAAFLK